MAEAVPATRAASGGRGATTALRPMTEAEYAGWRARVVPAYAADKVASGQWSSGEAAALSEAAYAALLPQGRSTPGHHLLTIVDADGEGVGVLWFAEVPRADGRIAHVYDIGIAPPRRREGHAWRALLALDDEARRLGLAGVGLHVFGHNPGAVALYERLGFVPTNISMFKPLPEAEPSIARTTPGIRAFASADFDAARALWEATPGVGLSTADERAAIEGFLQRNPGLSLVAEDAGGALVGTLLCGHDGRRGLIHHLVTAPSARRRGVATALLRQGLRGLRAAGIAKCHLMVFRDNAGGLAFWRAVGAVERVELALLSVPTGDEAR